MPYKDPKKRKQASKESMAKKRKGLTLGINNGGTVAENVNPKDYPAILHALTDPVKREKLENIYQSLKRFNQAENVYFGCAKGSVSFYVVGELLDATR